MKAKVVFRENLCKGCGFCVEFCPRKILTLGNKRNDLGYHYAIITSTDKCNGCAICAIMCPDVLIDIKEA